jgi:hypothetical protein
MSTRAHYEAQIKRFDSTFGNEFDKAVTKVINRTGLTWVTDDQIGEIRDQMLSDAVLRRKMSAQSRAHYAAQRAAS